MIRNWFWRFQGVFIFLFVFLIPFQYNLFSGFGVVSSDFVEAFIRFVGVRIIGISSTKEFSVFSDSTGMYVLVLCIVLFSILLSFIWSLLTKNGIQLIKKLVVAIAIYFVVLQLFKYGFNKVFKQQFYSPEPNILFSNVGSLTKDILYWSSIGTSYSYTVFMGVVEVLAGLLLFFRRTRFFALLIAFGVMVNVVAINFGFDISVKIFSTFLLYLVLLCLFYYRKKLVAIFANQIDNKSFSEFELFKDRKWFITTSLLKTFLLFLFLLEAALPNLSSNNLNDDKYVFSELQGAYSLSSNTNNLTHVFVHRAGYLIFKDSRNQMIDYKLTINELSSEMVLEKKGYLFSLTYDKVEDGSIKMKGVLQGDTLVLLAMPIDLSALPINENGFHWTVD